MTFTKKHVAGCPCWQRFGPTRFAEGQLNPILHVTTTLDERLYSAFTESNRHHHPPSKPKTSSKQTSCCPCGLPEGANLLLRTY